MSQVKLQEIIYLYRGQILQVVIEMESIIDSFIGDYFIADEEKRRELWMLIISPHIELMGKKEILRYILEKDGTNKKEDIAGLIKSIQEIIEARNMFAHWPISFSEEALKRFAEHSIITFVRLKPGKYQEHEKGPYKSALALEYHYPEKKVVSLLELITEVNKILKTLANI